MGLDGFKIRSHWTKPNAKAMLLINDYCRTEYNIHSKENSFSSSVNGPQPVFQLVSAAPDNSECLVIFHH